MGEKLVLLDTSILIEFFRKTEKINSRLYQLFDVFDAFGISVITEYEIFIGATSITQKNYWKGLRLFRLIPKPFKLLLL